MTDQCEGPAKADRLTEIAVQVGDAWLRGRGPLTGLKSLMAAHAEAIRLDADPEYLASFERIVGAARVLQGRSFNPAFRDAPRVLEHEIPRLRLAAGGA